MIIIHTCEEIHEEVPRLCSCKEEFSKARIAEFVKHGIVRFVKRYDYKRKKFYLDEESPFYSGVRGATPRSATIDAKHIVYAYVDGTSADATDKALGHRARLRIEEFGRLQKEFMASLTRPYDAATLKSAKDDLRMPDGQLCYGRNSAVVDAGDLVKPLEETNDQSKPAVTRTKESRRRRTKVSRSLSQPLVSRKKRRAWENDKLSRLRSKASRGELAVPPAGQGLLRGGSADQASAPTGEPVLAS